MVSGEGLRAIETRLAAGTVTTVEPLTPGALAVIVAVPRAFVATNPLLLTSLLMPATLVEEELHRTDDRT